jgi:mandelate racemase/muconate lactonizing protein
MKITALKTFVCNAYRTNFVFVKVETDSGLYGWGEATLEYKESTVVAAIHDLESYLINKDPHNIEAFRHDCYRDAYWRGGPVLMSALAGVEMALWDIKGKALNVPVYQLLGGAGARCGSGLRQWLVLSGENPRRICGKSVGSQSKTDAGMQMGSLWQSLAADLEKRPRQCNRVYPAGFGSDGQ